MTSNNDNYAPFFALHSLSFFSRSKLWRTLGVDFSRSRLYSVSRNSLDMRLSLRVTLVTRVITPPLPPANVITVGSRTTKRTYPDDPEGWAYRQIYKGGCPLSRA
jgi:hypothetical protein